MHKYEFSKNIESSFSGENLSSHGGMLSVGEYMLSKLGLESLLVKLINKEVNSKKIKSKKIKVILQKVFSVIAGYTTDNVDKYIKDDLVFKELLGKIVPKTTSNRITNTFKGYIKNALEKAIEKIEIYNIGASNKKSVIIDIDTSFDPASQNIGGVKYNHHYRMFCLNPIFAVDSLTGDIVKGELRPGNWSCSRGVVEFITSIVEMYKKNSVSITMRFDSGFGKPELYNYLESEQVTYAIKLKDNNSLQKNGKKIKDELELKPGQNKVVEFKYEAGTWGKERRVICSIDWINNETIESKADKKNKFGAKQYTLIPHYSFILTNDLKGTPEEILSLYNGRATVETVIEEAKNGFGITRLSHKSFEVNQSAFQIRLLAMQCTQLFRRHTLGTEKTVQEMTRKYSNTEHNGKFEGIPKIGRKKFILPVIQTLRKTLIEIPTKIVFGQRKRYFKFEKTFGGKSILDTAMERLKSIPKLQV